MNEMPRSHFDDKSKYSLREPKLVGWLNTTIPENEKTPEPMIDVAKKIAYYIGQAVNTPVVYEDKDIPDNSFYRLDGGRGFHSCTVENCGHMLAGVFGFKNWQFPTGIVHYIVDHNWKPSDEFLTDLKELPEPPGEVSVPVWAAPNKKGLFN